jgi:hypothetical protein
VKPNNLSYHLILSIAAHGSAQPARHSAQPVPASPPRAAHRPAPSRVPRARAGWSLRIPACNGFQPGRDRSDLPADGIPSGAAAVKQNSRYLYACLYGQTRALPLSSTTCLARTSLTRHRAQSFANNSAPSRPHSPDIHLGKRARAKLSDHEGMAALRWVTLPGIDESMVPPPGRSLPITGRTGRKLLLLRTHRGELSCLDASCFHQGEDLSHGEILDIEALGTVVQCPRHGAGRRDQTLGLITTSILEPLPTPRAACAVCLQAAAWML